MSARGIMGHGGAQAIGTWGWAGRPCAGRRGRDLILEIKINLGPEPEHGDCTLVNEKERPAPLGE